MFMPDKSCRTCGGELVNHKLCSDCRKSTQKKCRMCSSVTPVQSHQYCMNDQPSNQKPLLVQVIPKSNSSRIRGNSFHFSLVAIGIVGFFILGFAAYAGIPQGMPSEAQATTNGEIKIPSFPLLTAKSYDNCLAYGSGESITVTCPTDNGSVYKAILDMPQDLKKDFEGTVFSIRGVSVTENTDGSVIIQYQLQKYVTSYFGN